MGSRVKETFHFFILDWISWIIYSTDLFQCKGVICIHSEKYVSELGTGTFVKMQEVLWENSKPSLPLMILSLANLHGWATLRSS